MQLTLTGYYGFGNFGDDVILLSLLERLHAEPGVRAVNVLVRDDTYSGQPAFRLPGVHYHATRPLTGKLTKFGHFAASDLTVWGGGTCLYEPADGDIRGMESFLRNARLLRLLGRRYGFLGIGMGPLRSERARRITRRILAGASFVTFRDPPSLEIARALLPSRPPPRVEVCGDPFLLCDRRLLGFAGTEAERPRTPGQGKVGRTQPLGPAGGTPGAVPRGAGQGRQGHRALREIAFSGHFGLARDDRAVAFYAGQLDRLVEDLGVEVSLLPMQQSPEGDDNRFHDRLRERSRHRDKFHTLAWTGIESLMRLLEGIDLLVGMRLHSLLLADLLGVPAAGIALQPKVSFYLDAFRGLAPRRSYRLLEQIDPNDLARVADDSRKQRHLVEETLENLRSGAEKNLEVLRSFLTPGEPL